MPGTIVPASLGIGCGRLLDFKAYLPLGLVFGIDQLLYGFEHNAELLIIFAFHLFYFSLEIFMSGEHLAQTSECSYEQDIHLDGLVAKKRLARNISGLFEKDIIRFKKTELKKCVEF